MVRPDCGLKGLLVALSQKVEPLELDCLQNGWPARTPFSFECFRGDSGRQGEARAVIAREEPNEFERSKRVATLLWASGLLLKS
jgi:hypothetical protein